MPIFVDVMVNAGTVATIQIARIGDIQEGNIGNYLVVQDAAAQRKLVEVPLHDKEASVVGFDRSRGVLELVEESLKALREAGIER